MKVSSAQVATGQGAGKRNPASSLENDRSGDFASLLDLDGPGPDLNRTLDDKLAKKCNREKGKNDDHGQPMVVEKWTSDVRAVFGVQVVSTMGSPWQVEPDGPWKAADVAGLTFSSSFAEPVPGRTISTRLDLSPVDSQSVGRPATVPPQMQEDSASKPSVLQDLNGFNSGDPTENRLDDRGVDMKQLPATLNERGIPQIRASSSPIDSAAVRASIGLNASIPTSIAQIALIPKTTDIATSTEPSPSNHETQFADGRDKPPNTEDRATDISREDGEQPQLSVLQNAQHEAASSSVIADSWNTNSADEARRGGTHTDEINMDTALSGPQKLRDSAEGLGLNNSLPGHPGLPISVPLESIRESVPDAQIKGSAPWRATDGHAVQLLGTAMRGDLRVGVQTEAFGHVTIEANAQGGQLSAQLSVENAKESAALAAHLPAAEHRLIQQHGVTASVKLTNGFGGTASGFTGREQSASNRKNSGPFVTIRSGRTEQGSPNEGPGVELAVPVSRHFVTSRLDVTV